MTRNWKKKSCLLAATPLLPALLVGTAHLASNQVPTSSVGEHAVTVAVPTGLIAGSNATLNVAEVVSKGLYHFQGIVARLRVGGLPIEGEPVTFTASGVQICTAVTDVRGRARCNVKVETSKFSSQPATFDASFAGDGALQPAGPVTGALTVVG